MSLLTPDNLREILNDLINDLSSFRHLKYTLGLLNFHAKKTDLVLQEIYTRQNHMQSQL